MNRFLGKYVVSPLDGQPYCRKNGQFLEHIQLHGYNYQSLFEKFNPGCKEYCACGKESVFDIRKMSYKQTCGDKECANVITRAKRAARTDDQLNDWKQKYKDAMNQKTEVELLEIKQRRTTTGTERGSFKASVVQREQTCLERYGDKKYNNPNQISATKLDWDESRRQLFKDRLQIALTGRTLNDFHTEEMFSARRKMMEERGDVIPLDQLSEWELYRREVRNLTERNYRANKHVINPLTLTRKHMEYELDHIVPIFYGFQNNIPVDLIASVENLQMLPSAHNRSKGTRYDPTTNTKHKELEDQN